MVRLPSGTKPAAPASSSATPASGLSAEKMTTFAPRGPHDSAQLLAPSICGIDKSSRTRSGCRSRACSMATLPSWASPVTSNCGLCCRVPPGAEPTLSRRRPSTISTSSARSEGRRARGRRDHAWRCTSGSNASVPGLQPLLKHRSFTSMSTLTAGQEHESGASIAQTHQLVERFGGHRPGEVEPLAEIAPQRGQSHVLLSRLHSLAYGQVHQMRHLDRL